MQYSHIGRRAQIGETMTWVVATIIIIAILGISIFIASAKFNKDKTPDLQSVSRTDTLASKSLFSYVLTKNSTGQNVYEQLNGSNNLNDFNGNLAEKIFNVYKKDYTYLVWLGFLTEGNVYFGQSPAKQIGTAASNHVDPFANQNLAGSEDIKFYSGGNETNSLYLLLFKP